MNDRQGRWAGRNSDKDAVRSAVWDALDEGAENLRRVGPHAGCHFTRRNGVDPDTAGSQVYRQSLSQADHPRF